MTRTSFQTTNNVGLMWHRVRVMVFNYIVAVSFIVRGNRKKL
jgi:hypothetical protein